MKKLILSCLFFALLLFSHGANAYVTLSGDDIKITEKTYGDIYAVGGSLSVDAPVYGDIFFIGGELNVRQKVEGDINIISGKVSIDSEIGDDIRIIGGEIIILKNVGGDVIIAGGDIKISDPVLVAGSSMIYGGKVKNSSTISGDMSISGGDFDFDGTVFGNASIKVSDNLNVSKESNIRGSLAYSSPAKNNQLESITVGTKQYVPHVEEIVSPGSTFGFSFSIIYNFLFLFGFGVLFYFYLEKFFQGIQKEIVSNPLVTFLYGLSLFIGLPVISVILLITLIGIPFSFLGISLYIFLFIFAKLFVVIAFSAYLIDKAGNYTQVTVLKKVGIIVIVSIIFSFVPLVHILFSIFVYGAIMMKKIEILKELR